MASGVSNLIQKKGDVFFSFLFKAPEMLMTHCTLLNNLQNLEKCSASNNILDLNLESIHGILSRARNVHFRH